jgi:fission process protein 1
VSFGYIASDIFLKTVSAKPGVQMLTCLDQIAWHGIASLAVPGLLVHQTVHFSRKAVKNVANIHIRRILPVALGLGIIPFIVHPIDHYTDLLMDNTLRKLY